MPAAPKKQRPVKLVGCFFCGRKSQVHTKEDHDFCDHHWKVLTAVAPAHVVREYRRQHLQAGDVYHTRTTLKKAIRDLRALALYA